MGLFDQGNARDNDSDRQYDDYEYSGRTKSLLGVQPKELRAVSVKAKCHATTSSD